MANSTHHISQSNLDEQDPTSPDQFPPPAPLNEIIERSLGAFRPAQFIQAILISQPLLFDGQQTFISVYTDAEPTWHCSTNNSTCNSSSNVCKLSKTVWAWDGHVDKTIISEWGLECESSIITGLPASSYFMGCLIGGF
ncbi:organic cation/carnitine transporter 2-like, partial [Fagus crenata]